MASASVAPTITNIDLAPDDAIWLVETDFEYLKTILANPGAFVRNNVMVDGKPAILCEPFVVTFQPIYSESDWERVFVQGISGTAMLKVRYPVHDNARIRHAQVLPAHEPHCILQHGFQVYSHLELRGLSQEQVAEVIVKGIMTMGSFLEELNTLPQVINGQPVRPGENGLSFRAQSIESARLIYQGWSASTSRTSGMKDGDPPPDPSPTCAMTDGDADPNGNVWVNGVIVKTYSPEEEEPEKKP